MGVVFFDSSQCAHSHSKDHLFEEVSHDLASVISLRRVLLHKPGVLLEQGERNYL